MLYFRPLKVKVLARNLVSCGLVGFFSLSRVVTFHTFCQHRTGFLYFKATHTGDNIDTASYLVLDISKVRTRPYLPVMDKVRLDNVVTDNLFRHQ